MFILFLTAIGSARASFSLSILRGYIILLPAIFILAKVAGINGVWAAVPFTEFVITCIGGIIIYQRLKKLNKG